MGKIKSSGTKAAAKSGTEQTNNSKTISDDSFKSNFNHHDEQTKKSSSIGKMQLKTIKKAKRERPGILKLNKPSDRDRGKSDALKLNLLQQIKTAGPAQNLADASNATFVNKTQSFRLTNSLIKSLLKKTAASKSADETSNTEGLGSMLPGDLVKKGNVVKQIKKRDKTKLKKQIFQKKISLLQKHVKDTRAKARREKTVITGDMKPMIDSLMQAGRLTTVSKSAASKTSVASTTSVSNKLLLSSLVGEETAEEKVSKAKALSLFKQNKRDIHEKNVERENSKPIMKESVRNKKQNEDLNLFNELSTYSKFAENPLEMLRKTLAK